MEYTQEMLDWYIKRTLNHVFLVSKYIVEMVYHYGLYGIELFERKDKHDLSKFEEPEKTPYILISWQYHCKDLGIDFSISENNKIMMTSATYHHVTTNTHHPEYYSLNKLDIINRENRDVPTKNLVDATTMPDIDICEMMADWLAMAEEKGTSVREWANKNVNIRWKFNENQINQIYRIIDVFNFDNK